MKDQVGAPGGKFLPGWAQPSRESCGFLPWVPLEVTGGSGGRWLGGLPPVHHLLGGLRLLDVYSPRRQVPRYRELPCHLSVKWGNLILEETHGASRAGRGPCSSVTSRRAGGDPVRVWVSACGPPRPRVSGDCYLLACVFAHHHAVI